MWGNRALIIGPYFCLCLNEEEFKQAMRHINVVPQYPWVNPGAGATTHTHQSNLPSNTDKLCCITCLAPPPKGANLWAIHALLVHEALHIWQAWRRDVGETHPGDEQEAYSVQHLSGELMRIYDERKDK